jgi:hypothetical protein
MGRFRQAIRERIHAVQCRVNQRVEELAFQASVRAIKETRWMAHETALSTATQAATSAITSAFASYVPPTPWAEAWVDEVTQVLDSVIAEQFRLQAQVEELEQLLRAALADRGETVREETLGRRQETGVRRQESGGNGSCH